VGGGTTHCSLASLHTVLDWENGKWEMPSWKTGKFPLSHLVDEVGKWEDVGSSGKMGQIELLQSYK